jgi:hypothetical protein
MKHWDYAHITRRCSSDHQPEDEQKDDDITDNLDGDGDDDDDGHDNPQLGSVSVTGLSQSSQVSSAVTISSVGHNVKSSQRYTYAKKLFDEIAVFFPSRDLFTSFVDVMRAVIVTCKSGDPTVGIARIKSYITVDPRLQKPKTNEPTLLPAVIVKEGRKKHNNRGRMVREMRTSAPQCTFCLSRDPVHRVGSKCKPLMSKGMNTELNAQNFPLLLSRPLALATHLLSYSGTVKPLFVHVLHKAAHTMDNSSPEKSVHVDAAYICTLYVHAADCLGTYVISTPTITEWTAKRTCRVFISATHELPCSGTLNNTEPKIQLFGSGSNSSAAPLTNTFTSTTNAEKRKQASCTGSQRLPDTPASRMSIDAQVEKLRTVWDKRLRNVEDSWVESRIGRITGTTAKIVMVGKNDPSAIQLANLFGLSPAFQATTHMQIGNLLESKILQSYCKLQKLQLKKDRGGRTLTLLYQHNYVGHTPDGKTIQSKVNEPEVLEVKVVFNTHETIDMLVKKHTHQLQLGLFVHRCNAGRLLVYRCALDMTLSEATDREVASNAIEEYRFSQDKEWIAKFKPLVEAFYTEHLEWFYERTFDMEHARLKVASIMAGVDTRRSRVASFKKRQCVIKGTQNA